jgi:rRNA maturation endonuclease Nob1
MSLVDKLKDMLVPQTEKGVRIECGNCGSTFEEDVTECPECGSQELIERESFEMRPSQ